MAQHEELHRLVVCPLTHHLLVDHTLLGENDTEEKVVALVRDALEVPQQDEQAVAICIHRPFVKAARVAARRFEGKQLRIATVVNFPQGKDSPEKCVEDTRSAIADGADEIDLVVDYSKIIEDKAKGIAAAKSLVQLVRSCCPAEILLKVIVESGELKTPERIIAATWAALEGGADFVKTSTGKVPVNATLEAANSMLTTLALWRIVHPHAVVGFKPAGGVKNPQMALEYLQLAESIMGRGWVTSRTFRFGASSLLGSLRNALESEENVLCSGANVVPSVAAY